jgi:hypothetical protein
MSHVFSSSVRTVDCNLLLLRVSEESRLNGMLFFQTGNGENIRVQGTSGEKPAGDKCESPAPPIPPMHPAAAKGNAL